MGTVFHEKGAIQRLFRENNLPAISAAIRNHITALSAYDRNHANGIRHFLFEYVQGITNESLRLGLDVSRMESCATAISRLFQGTDSNRQIDAALDLTANLMTGFSMRHASEKHHLIELAKEYIPNNLSDKRMCLDSVANSIGLSKFYFCKLFHQVGGISFNAYLKQKRIVLAKTFLASTNMKVFEVSDAAEFSNVKHFSFVFKQDVGLTPLDFQRHPEYHPGT